MSLDLDERALCVACWNRQHPQKPTRPGTTDDCGNYWPEQRCADCGKMTTAGIFVQSLRVPPAPTPAFEARLKVTGTRIERRGAHDHVSVWLDHRNVGTLTVNAGDGESLMHLLETGSAIDQGIQGIVNTVRSMPRELHAAAVESYCQTLARQLTNVTQDTIGAVAVNEAERCPQTAVTGDRCALKRGHRGTHCAVTAMPMNEANDDDPRCPALHDNGQRCRLPRDHDGMHEMHVEVALDIKDLAELMRDPTGFVNRRAAEPPRKPN